jgi:SAM-dependent methyltransferase
MQDDTRLKSVLRSASIYSAFQNLIGARKAWNWFIGEHVRPQAGQKIIDIGCGPGDILESLPDVRYVGLDISEPYISLARKRYGNRGTFLLGDAGACIGNPALAGADIVMCYDVLHHLDDPEVNQVFTLARRHLVPGGRFAGVEPCRLRHQTPVSRWIMSKDRGQNIRLEDEWKGLLAAEFPGGVRTQVLTGLTRIPYIHIALEGIRA